MATQCFREDSSWTPERMDLDDLLVVALDLLRSHDLGASDALTILQARFSHGSHEPDTDTVVYSHTQDGAPALVVRYGTRGRVAALEAGSALTADDLTELINSLTAERPPRVWALVAFSSVPTEGSWRYADRMQITPVPPEPPTAPFLLADHPFVIEVAYAGAEDWHLDMRRAQAAAREVSRLLAGFLRRVDDRTGHFSRSEWVFEPAHDEGGQLSMTTRFAQLGYVAEGVGGRSEQFSDTSDMPAVRRVPASEYYANAGITVGESLSLPRLGRGRARRLLRG